MHTPKIPLVTTMTAANTVSRATTAESGESLVIIETMRPTSITVTANASTIAPSEGPIFAAMASAWCTAVATERPRIPMARMVPTGDDAPTLTTIASATNDRGETRWLAVRDLLGLSAMSAEYRNRPGPTNVWRRGSP